MAKIGKLIIALTETGHTARVISKYRPPCPILAITASEPTLRQMLANRGVVPILTASFQGTDSVIAKALAKAKEINMVKPGDNVVALHGQKEECPGAVLRSSYDSFLTVTKMIVKHGETVC